MSKHSNEGQKAHSSNLVPHSFSRIIISDDCSEVSRHYHQEFELLLIREGTCCFFHNDKMFIAQKGDIILIQPNVIHAIIKHCDEYVIFDSIMFHPYMITGEVNDRAYIDIFESIFSGKNKITIPISINNSHYTEIRTLVERIFIYSLQNSAYHDILMKIELMHMFIFLIDSGEITKNYDNIIETDTTLAPVISYIKSHFHEELTIELLAQTAHLSKSYFMGYFRKIMGMSAMKYIDNIRIEKVCELLRNTNESITHIASHCGFNNIANFNRHFQKAVGMTPSEYRKAPEKLLNNKSRSIIVKTNIYDAPLREAYCNIVQKAKQKGKNQSEVNEILCWLTGYTHSQLEEQLGQNISYHQFFENAPQINPNCHLIKGILSDIHVELIEKPIMQKIHWLDELKEELSKEKSINIILIDYVQKD